MRTAQDHPPARDEQDHDDALQNDQSSDRASSAGQSNGSSTRQVIAHENGATGNPLPTDTGRDTDAGLCTQNPALQSITNPVVYRSERTRITTKRLRRALEWLAANAGRVSDDHYVVRHAGTTWTGTGLSEFNRRLQLLASGNHGSALDAESDGRALYIQRRKEKEFLLLSVQCGGQQVSHAQVQLGLLVDGPSREATLSAQLRHEFQLAEYSLPVWSPQHYCVDLNVPYELDVVAPVPTPDAEHLRASAVGRVVVKNPFQESRQLRQHLRTAIVADARSTDRQPAPTELVEHLQSPDHLMVQLAKLRPASAAYTCDLQTISVHDLRSVFPTADVCNVGLIGSA